jgi:hypothetical protein
MPRYARQSFCKSPVPGRSRLLASVTAETAPMSGHDVTLIPIPLSRTATASVPSRSAEVVTRGGFRPILDIVGMLRKSVERCSTPIPLEAGVIHAGPGVRIQGNRRVAAHQTVGWNGGEEPSSVKGREYSRRLQQGSHLDDAILHRCVSTRSSLRLPRPESSPAKGDGS